MVYTTQFEAKITSSLEGVYKVSLEDTECDHR